MNLDCPTTCSKAGLSSINGGTSGQALCVRERDGATFYGADTRGLERCLQRSACCSWPLSPTFATYQHNALIACAASLSHLYRYEQTGLSSTVPLPLISVGLWSQADKRCYYIKDKEVWYAVSGYKCACVSSSTSLGWEANTACASSPRAASTSPPICRFSKPNSNGPWTMGWYDTRAGICYARGKGFSPDGRTVIGVTRLGGSYNAQLLCVSESTRDLCRLAR